MGYLRTLRTPPAAERRPTFRRPTPSLLAHPAALARSVPPTPLAISRPLFIPPRLGCSGKCLFRPAGTGRAGGGPSMIRKGQRLLFLLLAASCCASGCAISQPWNLDPRAVRLEV